MFEDVNLLIGTPAYNGLTHIDYNNTILNLSTFKIKQSVMFVGNESLITRARNTIISTFYSMKQFTHLLFLDGDVGLINDGNFSGIPILKLLQYNKDVIGIPIKLKGTDEKGNPVYNVSMVEKTEEEGLYKVAKIGTAALLLSRKACDDLIKSAIKRNDIYQNNKYTRGNKLDTPHYDIFKVGVVDGIYLSEDFYVCNQLRSMGYTIYCDDTIESTHNGMMRV